MRAARTLRRRLLEIPGRLTRHGRGWTLHLPARWPWHGDYISALAAAWAAPPATRPTTPPRRSLAGRDSVRQHERIIAAAAAGDVPKTSGLVRENWLSLGTLIDRSFE